MDMFKNGAEWLRADFHLHTKADKHFKYSGDENFYLSNYVNALETAGIRVGLITNHNKFDFGEFRSLRTTAKKKGIFLLPGVELSVSDGANGVHVLIAFGDSWLKDGQDRISLFLTSMFPGKTSDEYQNGNGRSDKGILQTVEELEKTERDYFLIFPHVEDNKGLWREIGGGRLEEWREKRYHEVRKRTLGFQKVRTDDDRKKVKNWLGDWYPAEVEGSDPKQISEIGRGNHCFVKLGAFTFKAVEFALTDHTARLRADAAPKFTHSHIKKISFDGGTLDGREIRFSPELNTLIGIRGSGKSSVLEALRYALNIPIPENDADKEYKQKLVGQTLGSGGKVTLDAVDKHGQSYQIRRIWKGSADVFIDGKLQPGISIRETILNKPLFFGQKELVSAGHGGEKDLIEKLIGDKCDDIRRKITEQKTRVTDAIDRLSKVRNVGELIEEEKKSKQDAEFRLNFYKEHKLEEKLQKRLGFEADIRKAEAGTALVEAFAVDMRELLAKHEDELRNFPGYISVNNAEFFIWFDERFAEIIQSMESVKSELMKSETALGTLKKGYARLVEEKEKLAEEFAEIERTLAAELKVSGGQNFSSDEFLELKRKLSQAEIALDDLEKSGVRKIELKDALQRELQKLNELWRDEFKIIKGELDDVSQINAALKFTVDFEGDKTAFLNFFKEIFRGSGVRENTLQNIVDQYQGFIGIYSDFENAKKYFGSNPTGFSEIFEQNLKTLLTYQTPNRYTIEYRGVKLADHSLGQRASALILFVLGQRENDVIVIDQPEDDLDNQTIYEDVIKLIRKLKPNMQFILATHNPNIPVLGDAEHVHVCSFSDEKITVQSGGLDDPEQQKRIVTIMEGGEEAFERRKVIYNIWK